MFSFFNRLSNGVRAWFHLTPPTTTTFQRGAECSMRFLLEAGTMTLLFRMGMDAGIFDDPNEEHPTEAAIITQRLFFMLGYIVTDNWLIRPALDWTRDEARKLLRSLVPQMEMPLSEIDIGIQVLRGTIPASNRFRAVTSTHVASLSAALNIPHNAALRIFREFAADSRGKWLLALKNSGFLTLTMGLPFLYGLTRFLGAIDTKDWKPCEIGALSMLCVAVIDGLVQASADAVLHDDCRWTPSCCTLRLPFEQESKQSEEAADPLLCNYQPFEGVNTLLIEQNVSPVPSSPHQTKEENLVLFENLDDEEKQSDDLFPITPVPLQKKSSQRQQPSKPISISRTSDQQMQLFVSHTPSVQKNDPANQLSHSYQ